MLIVIIPISAAEVSKTYNNSVSGRVSSGSTTSTSYEALETRITVWAVNGSVLGEYSNNSGIRPNAAYTSLTVPVGYRISQITSKHWATSGFSKTLVKKY